MAFTVYYQEMFAIGQADAASSESSFVPFLVAGIFYFVFNAVVGLSSWGRLEKQHELFTVRGERHGTSDEPRIRRALTTRRCTCLKDISLSVEKGEVVAIIGPSGSGKSTLLRCATLLTEMDSGELIYGDIQAVHNDADGKAVYADKGELKKVREKFGLVFQSFNLFPHYSVLKNLMDPQIRVLGRDKGEAQQRARKLLEKMGLSDKENAYPCELSGGQQQRVAIARALAMDPEILFFDEPTSGVGSGADRRDSEGDPRSGGGTHDHGHRHP